MPNVDAYQMLAYCTALGLPHGFLVYAKDSGEQPRTYEVLKSKCVIEVRTLDVEVGPDLLLQQVQALAAEIARRASASRAA
jgi:5-methylcytosine-specific restriction enzyme subunit McrC